MPIRAIAVSEIVAAARTARIACVDAVCDWVVAFVVVKEREVPQPVEGIHKWREAVEEESEQRGRRCCPGRETTPTGRGREREGERPDRPAQEHEVKRDGGDLRELDAASANGDANDQPEEGTQGYEGHADRDCGGLRRARGLSA